MLTFEQTNVWMKIFSTFLFLVCFNLYCQQTTYPVFENCQSKTSLELQKKCFDTEFLNVLESALNESNTNVEETSKVGLIFDVDEEGKFNLIFIDSDKQKLKSVFEKAFKSLPQIEPARSLGNPTYMQFNMELLFPLQYNTVNRKVDQIKDADTIKTDLSNKLLEAKNEYDKIEKESKKYDGDLYSSFVNIPFSHEIYNRFDREINLIGTNSHTAQKPFTYLDVKPYYDFKVENEKLAFNKKSWLGQKLFDEHLATVSGENYWFAVDFGVDLQLGRDAGNDLNTYNNTRIGYIQGGIGKKLTYYGAIFESQGRFADYFNRLARSRNPADGYPAVVPGRGVAKSFGDNGFDYPVTEGYINYRFNDNFNLQVGNYRNFIGDGYRSLFLSDNASPNPYVKIDAEFWKVKYTNIYMQARNTNFLTEGGAYSTKFIALHHLSWNVNKRLNIGLFEAAIWNNEAERGFDISYLNPLLFYQMVEFSTGTDSGKVMVGLNYKYKWTDHIYSYGQLLIDELSVDDVFGGDQSFKNKFGLQLGVKYFDAFKVKDFDLQFEYNQVRPYTYSHFQQVTNYAHVGQSLAHLWGTNFREAIAIARYRKDRWYGHAKFIYGLRGFEPNADNMPFFGSNLFGTERNIFSESGVKIGQGNKANSTFAELEVGYLVNPSTNLKLYMNLIHRDFSIEVQNERNFDNSTTWINFGLRADLFNWYFDY
jgi:hypothetical protein